MKKAFLFQGQGSQIVGMGKDLYDHYQIFREIFDEANDSTGVDFTSIIFSGPKAVLDLTINTQPALMLHSIAILKLIEHLSGKKLEEYCSYVAGHSLGEYTAICAAGMISIKDTLQLLRLRGKSMQEAVPLGVGAMAAILGAEYEIVEQILQVVNHTGVCAIGNDNCPGQIVISGTTEAIDEAIKLTKELGKKAVRLEVSAPFHCPLMDPVKKIMQDALDKIAMKKPQVPIITNVNAQETTDPLKIKTLLVEQISAQVKWRQSINYLVGKGVRSMYELGTGKVLAGLNKRIDESIVTMVLSDRDSVLKYVEGLDL